MWKSGLILLLAFAVLIPSVSFTHAETSTSTIQGQIDATNAKIKQLQDEIAALQGQLTDTSKQKQTLQNAIKELNLNIQKLQKSISLTQTQIGQKDQQIGVLAGSIATTAEHISGVQKQIAEGLRQLHSLDNESLVSMFLAGGTLSTFFDESHSIALLREDLSHKADELNTLKQNLQSSKSQTESKKGELVGLKATLNNQKLGLSVNRDNQSQLLVQTKNQETLYQQQIAQKKKQEDQFEQELENYEAQLGLHVNKGDIPHPGSGVLQWPVDKPLVTQYFGNTAFATANPQIYSGKGHNAIDLRATIGTPIKAARAGTIKGTGNTDTTCPGASYGKWVFIDHDNGLSTLYAHLSVISVSEGETVEVGQVIGYSGQTGYATGPHLHFGVYATEGSKIASFPSKSCSGRIYTVPLADPSAYLNPLSYL